MTARRDLRAIRAAAYENPRPEVVALVPRGARRVLDLGCSSGALGAALKARAAAGDAHRAIEVVGVERDADYARDARARLDRVLCADLEALPADGAATLERGLGRFDCLIAADVLEHLVDPWSVLRTFAALLEPGGSAIVSLPNVRHWESLWQLAVRGTWPRRAEGIHDATHLRWFTLADAYGLIEPAGLKVVSVHRVIRLHARGTRLDARVAWLARVPVLRPFVTFQHVLRAEAAPHPRKTAC